MKKILSLSLVLLLAFSLFAGCTKPDDTTVDTPDDGKEATPVTVKIAGLKGPTSMGLVSLMNKAENKETLDNYEFTMAAAATEVNPKLIQGELDMAAIPANVAAILYNNTKGGVKVLAVNTLGVVYIAEKGNTVTDIASLKGKTIYATGKGSIPEYALKYILAQNGVDPENDVTIEWKSEPTEVVAIMKSSENAVAMLPQPFVTVAQNQVEGLHVAINLNEEWEKLDNGSLFITGVLIARTEFIENNPEAVARFMAEYEASVNDINTNVEECAALVEKYGIVNAAIATKAIPYCNLTFIDGEEMETALSGCLEVLFNQNPASVGGTLPADDFYYNGN
jgi:NitT/TauT family transport system substrate-binding protein